MRRWQRAGCGGGAEGGRGPPVAKTLGCHRPHSPLPFPIPQSSAFPPRPSKPLTTCMTLEVSAPGLSSLASRASPRPFTASLCCCVRCRQARRSSNAAALSGKSTTMSNNSPMRVSASACGGERAGVGVRLRETIVQGEGVPRDARLDLPPHERRAGLGIGCDQPRGRWNGGMVRVRSHGSGARGWARPPHGSRAPGSGWARPRAR